MTGKYLHICTGQAVDIVSAEFVKLICSMENRATKENERSFFCAHPYNKHTISVKIISYILQCMKDMRHMLDESRNHCIEPEFFSYIYFFTASLLCILLDCYFAIQYQT